MKEPTKADLAAAVAKLTEENKGMRDLFAAISLAADAVPVAKGSDYSGEWRRSTTVLANIKTASNLDDWTGRFAFWSGELRKLAAEPVGYDVYAEPEPVSPGEGGVLFPAGANTLVHDCGGAEQCFCGADEPASPEVAEALYDAIVAGTPVLVQADPYARERAEGDADLAAMSAYCPAETVDEDDERVVLYCDREAGHTGSHHAPGPDEGSEVAWSDESAQDETPAEFCTSVMPLRHGGEIKCMRDEGHHGAHEALDGKLRWLGHGADARDESGDKIAPASVTA